jgi:hypothetical protein
VILVASFVPVRRATRIAPADALRNEWMLTLWLKKLDCQGSVFDSH